MGPEIWWLHEEAKAVVIAPRTVAINAATTFPPSSPPTKFPVSWGSLFLTYNARSSFTLMLFCEGVGKGAVYTCENMVVFFSLSSYKVLESTRKNLLLE